MKILTMILASAWYFEELIWSNWWCQLCLAYNSNIAHIAVYNVLKLLLIVPVWSVCWLVFAALGSLYHPCRIHVVVLSFYKPFDKVLLLTTILTATLVVVFAVTHRLVLILLTVAWYLCSKLSQSTNYDVLLSSFSCYDIYKYFKLRHTQEFYYTR